MPKIIIEDAHGKYIEVTVSKAIAIYIQENDSYMKRLENIDDRHFRLVHFDKPAWENMQGLSTTYSAEDEAFGVPEETSELERLDYQRRLAWCRQMLHRLQNACTQTQWRRYELNKAFGYTTREIAEMERRHHASIEESINAVEEKIKIIFSKRA